MAHTPRLEEYCVICGQALIDPAPTGLTCRNQQCLLELGKTYINSLNTLARLADKIGVYADVSGTLEGIAEAIQEKVMNDQVAVENRLEEISGLLDLEIAGLNLDDICDEIVDAINCLHETIAGLEEDKEDLN